MTYRELSFKKHPLLRGAVPALGPIAVFLFFLAPLYAQRGASIPAATHYKTVQLLQEGRFAEAAQFCRDELAGATKIGQQRWIDSICYYAVLGEAAYITGDLSAALESFESAIDIYLSTPDWIARVEYPTGTRHSEGTAPPWGAGTRNLPLGLFPNDAMIRIGDPITDERIKQGGMLKNPELRRIDPVEILRCTALAVRRRNEILGPLAAADHRSRPIVECFSKRPVSRNHWSSPFLDVILGLGLEGAGKHEEAINRLSNSLLMEGEYNHFLASSALIALGDIYLKSGKVFEAADSYFEGSVSAYAFGSVLEIEEALRKLAAADILRNDPESELPIDLVQSWISNNVRSGWIAASFHLLAAEKLIRHGDTAGAEQLLRGVPGALKSSGLTESRYADLYRYLASVAAFRQGNLDEGEELLGQACAGARERSFRFFQIHRLNQSLDEMTPRTAADLYDELLRISDFYDWAADPVASYAADTSLWTEELNNAFLLAIDRDQPEKAFEIAERIRIRRFLTFQEMGGRAFSLRYLAAAPDHLLTEETRVLRQNLFVEYPELETFRKNAARITEQLQPFSISPDSEKQAADQLLLEQLQAVSDEEEICLRGIAAMPFAVPEVFPPRENFNKLREKIPEKAAVLSFIEVGGALYGFLMTRDEFDSWRLGSVAGIGRELAAFLDACGATDGNKAKLLKEFLSEEWRGEGNSFFRALLGNPTGDDVRGRAQFESLAVVPDSILWYCPFDAMTLPQGEKLVPLAKVPNFTLFCAPTVTLCFTRAETGTQLRGETVLIPGKLHPKENDALQRAVLARLEKTLPKSAVWPEPLRTGSDRLYISQIRKLAVLGEIRAVDPAWGLFNPSAKKSAEPLLQWRFLPWGGPKTVLLIGLRSDAETAIKEGRNGSEFFMPLLMMQANGAETILASRWRVGGPSAYSIAELFLDKTEKTPAPAAWKEVLAEFTAAPLNLKEEPRFRGTPPKEAIIGEHPFFWGGYMLVSRGFVPAESENGEETGLSETPEKDPVPPAETDRTTEVPPEDENAPETEKDAPPAWDTDSESEQDEEAAEEKKDENSPPASEEGEE
ncbi:MAG: tetratricopeptide repeat protein [Thermoguttaceae bacterium]|nr:tetratricopeptide repeat protein [Thermoguttaceae bacterium]